MDTRSSALGVSCRTSAAGALLVLLVLSAPPALAQEDARSPTGRQEDPERPAADEADAEPAVTSQDGIQRWTFATNARHAQTDNVFLINPDDPGDGIESLGLSLGYTRSSARAATSLNASVSGIVYDELGGDGVQGGLGYGGSYRLSPRVRLSLSEALGYGVNADSLYAARLQLPELSVWTSQTSASLAVEAGPNTALSIDLGASWLRYRSESPFDGAPVVLDPSALDRLRARRPLPSARPGDPPPAGDPSLLILSLLATEGVRETRFEGVTYYGGLGLTRLLSSRTTGIVSVGYRGTRFDATGLENGSGLSAHGELRQRFGATVGAALVYDFEESSTQVPSVRTHAVVAQVDKSVAEAVRLDASGGFSRVTGGSAIAAEHAFVGGAGVQARFRRTELGLRYNRSVYPSLGFGRTLLSDVASAGLSQDLAKWLNVWMSAGYRSSEDTLDPAYAFSTFLSSAGLRFQVDRRTSFGVDYGFRRIDREGAEPRFDSSIWSVFVGHSVTWR
jgi:hypothetical protein